MQRITAKNAALFSLLLLAACAHRPTPTVAPSEPPAAPLSYSIGPQQTSIGANATYIVRTQDTLLDVARQYDLGYTQLMAANPGVDPWNPKAGRAITLPSQYLLPNAPRHGIVINLVQQRLFYFHDDGKTVETFPIGVGVQGRATPFGITHVVKKMAHPVWHVPTSIRAEDPTLPASVPPGPDNPLGDYAFALGWPSYLIHATNKPDGIGRNVSHGCIQLYPEDMARLFEEVPIGTDVRVVDQEVETAWVDDELYVAVFPNKKQSEAIGENRMAEPEIPSRLMKQVKAAAGSQSPRIDWLTVDAAGRGRAGIPTRVTFDPKGGEKLAAD